MSWAGWHRVPDGRGPSLVAGAVSRPGEPGAKLSSLRNERKSLISQLSLGLLLSEGARQWKGCALAWDLDLWFDSIATPSVALGSPVPPRLGATVLSSHM